MADESSTAVTLDGVTDAIVARLATIPGVETCEAYPAERTKVAMPALILEAVEWEMDDDEPMTDQTSVTVRWRCYCLADGYGPTPQRAVRNLAMAATAKLRRQRCGVRMSPIDIVMVYRDEEKPDMEDLEVWTVEFISTFCVDEGAFVPLEQDPPAEVWVGHAPKVGPPNLVSYEKLVPEDEP